MVYIEELISFLMIKGSSGITLIGFYADCHPSFLNRREEVLI
jgi:hypothetical protein